MDELSSIERHKQFICKKETSEFGVVPDRKKCNDHQWPRIEVLRYINGITFL